MDSFCVFTLDQLNHNATLVELCIPNEIILSLENLYDPTENQTGYFVEKVAKVSDSNQMWVLATAAFVFFMQFGFTLVESGAVRAPNIQSILVKNLINVFCVVIGWYLFGYSIAFGSKSNDEDEVLTGFIGTNNVGLGNLKPSKYNIWFFQFAFASVTVSIVAGGMLERCTVITYICYSFLLSMWVYPTVVHWIWDENGWLSPQNTTNNTFIDGGVIDFAGSGVVHMVGGFSAFAGAMILGPRLGRFKGQKGKFDKFASLRTERDNAGNSAAFQIFGMFFLWFGWFGFNCGSTLAIENGAVTVASKAALNTVFGASLGGIGGLLISYKLEGAWTIPRVCNGVLSGLVSVTAACGVVSETDSMVIGLLGAFVYYMTSRLLEIVKIDDPMDAFAVHGMCGAWGVLATGLWASKKSLIAAGYDNIDLIEASAGYRFSIQLLGVVAIIVWVVANMSILFLLLKLFGLLRIKLIVEETGLDMAENGVFAVFYFEQITRNEQIREPSRSSNGSNRSTGNRSLGLRSPSNGSLGAGRTTPQLNTRERLATMTYESDRELTPTNEHGRDRPQQRKKLQLSDLTPATPSERVVVMSSVMPGKGVH